MGGEAYGEKHRYLCQWRLNQRLGRGTAKPCSLRAGPMSTVRSVFSWQSAPSTSSRHRPEPLAPSSHARTSGRASTAAGADTSNGGPRSRETALRYALPIFVLLSCVLHAGCNSRLVSDGLPTSQYSSGIGGTISVAVRTALMDRRVTRRRASERRDGFALLLFAVVVSTRAPRIAADTREDPEPQALSHTNWSRINDRRLYSKIIRNTLIGKKLPLKGIIATLLWQLFSFYI